MAQYEQQESNAKFWADQLAEETATRAKGEKQTASIRCGQTPSGGKHIGNLNDVVRAYFVYKSLEEKGVKSVFIHSTDDRDPLKDVPTRIADLDGNWHQSDKFPKIKEWLGKPLCRIPDPFSCCKSWSVHFTELWVRGLHAIGMKPKIVSNDDYYKQGKCDPYIKMVFEKIKRVGEIVAQFQETKGENYLPFDAICPNCGVLTNISSFDVKKKTVSFTCGGKAIKKNRAEGCGYEGTVPWSEGKLQWRFEWPAQWAIEKTDFEPMGKDHWEGSWKSGMVIAKEIYEIEPPIPYVYEFFLVDGQKMSASKGNVYIVQDMMKIIEPETFVYFYTKRPGKQRDLSLKEIFMLANEFDSIENMYFNREKIKDSRDRLNVERSYFMSVEKIPQKKPPRIPFTFAAMIAQIVPQERMLEAGIKLLGGTGHVEGKLTEEEKKIISKRLQLAKFWAEHYAPEYKISLLEKPPAEAKSFSKDEREALHELAKDLQGKKLSEDKLYEKFMEIADKHGIESKDFFRTAYLSLIGKSAGPRLAPFILAIGEKEAAERFSRV